MSDFLTQFQTLLLKKPRYNVKIFNSENCDYADTAVNSQDCYYSFGAFHCEHVLYARYSRNCTNCSDITFCFNCEWCHECVGCSKSYGLSHCKYCDNCANCSFCEDCVGCKDCFGCVGLYQKQYCLFNEQLSKEEYEKRISQLDLNNPEHLQAIWARLEQLKQSKPQLATHQTMTENSVGDNLVQTRNAYQCFDAYDLEDCGYCIETNSLKNCYDMTVCFKTEESYQCIHCPQNYGLKFCQHCDNCSESEFCAYSMNLKNCFGCVYVKDKEYHILNQPYEKEDYFKKVEEIKKELVGIGMYNLQPYFISDYEQSRLANETDPAIGSSVAEF